jgi:hypothetical protein
MRTSALVLALMLGMVTGSSAQPKFWCDGREIPLKYPKDMGVHLEGLVFTSAGESAYGTVKFVNTGPKSIQNYLLLLEFYSAARKHLLTAAVYNLDKHGVSPLEYPFKDWLYANGNASADSIGPGATAELQFFSPTLALECPTEAEITELDLLFDDATVLQRTVSQATLDPVVRAARPTDWGSWRPLARRALTGTLTVDQDGHASIHPMEGHGPALEGFLRSEIEHWDFAPAAIGSAVVEGNASFMLTAGDTPRDFAALSELRSRGVTAVLCLRVAPDPANGHVEVWAGGARVPRRRNK